MFQLVLTVVVLRPDANVTKVLTDSITAYRALSSYSHRSASQLEITRSGSRHPLASSKGRFLFLAPKSMLFDSTIKSGDGGYVDRVVFWSNGKTCWQWDKTEGKKKVADFLALSKIIGEADGWPIPDFLDKRIPNSVHMASWPSPKLLPEKSVVGNRCYRLRQTYKNGTYTEIWVDKKSKLIRRQSTLKVIDQSERLGEVTTFTLQPKQRMSDRDFEFVPPKR